MTVANNGSAAVEIIMSRGFDVVVSDVHMTGMTGVELLSVVRAYDLDVPVILMTGDPTVETAMEAVSLGAVEYLRKPITQRGPREVGRARLASSPHGAHQARRPQLAGEGRRAGGRSRGPPTRFERALESMWMAFQPIVDSGIGGSSATRRSCAPARRAFRIRARCSRPPSGWGASRSRRVRPALCVEAFERAPRDTLLFINVHPHDLLDKELYDADAPLTRIAHRVVLEITERSAISDVKDIQARVAVLRYHGFRIAIDDLGAGYAGLSSFVALAPEIVKLDMSLVRGVDSSEIRQRLIGSMVLLCSEMGIRAVAEGVETSGESECVRRLGCDLLQGYLFAKPGPPFPAAETFV